MTLADTVGHRIVRIGTSGAIVSAIQEALKAHGYPLKGTGYFGTDTMTAVRDFQKRTGITVDGDVGPATAGALDASSSPDVSHPAVIVPAKQEIERPLWLTAGIALIGTKEGPGPKDNPVIINWAKDEGGDIAKEYTHDSIPWCALFANHCLTLAGLPGTHTLWALDFAGHWPSKRLSGPAVGAFAPMLRNGGGHIIQIVGKAENGNLMGLGGNQSDAVNIEEFAVSRLNQGYWWPISVPVPAQVGFSTLPVVASSGKISSNEA